MISGIQILYCTVFGYTDLKLQSLRLIKKLRSLYKMKWKWKCIWRIVNKHKLPLTWSNWNVIDSDNNKALFLCFRPSRHSSIEFLFVFTLNYKIQYKIYLYYIHRYKYRDKIQVAAVNARLVMCFDLSTAFLFVLLAQNIYTIDSCSMRWETREGSNICCCLYYASYQSISLYIKCIYISVYYLSLFSYNLCQI